MLTPVIATVAALSLGGFAGAETLPTSAPDVQGAVRGDIAEEARTVVPITTGWKFRFGATRPALRRPAMTTPLGIRWTCLTPGTTWASTA